MEKALFSITCTTCHARLAVRSAEVLGAILECPKCQSMVLVEPPEGWSIETANMAEVDPGDAPGKAPSEGLAKGKPAGGSSIRLKSSLVVAAALPNASDSAEPVPTGVAPPIATAKAPPVVAAAVPAAPPVATAPAAPAAPAVAGPPAPVTPEPPPPATVRPWLAWFDSAWGRWTVLLISPVLGLVLVLVAAMLLSHRSEPPTAASSDEAVDPKTAEPTPAAPSKPRPKPRSTGIERRWLPDQTRLVLSLCGSRFDAQTQAGKLLGQAGTWWEPSAGAVLRGLGLRLDQVQRLTVASTDLAAWTAGKAAAPPCVVVVELEDGPSAATILPHGEAVDLGTPDLAFRRIPGGAWPHPYAAVGPQTIVTGQEDLLRGLVGRSEAHLASSPIDRLLKVIAPESDAVLLVDLAAARAVPWKLPASLLDVWPAGKRAWHAAWEIPEGLGVVVQWSEPVRSEVALVCEGDTVAEKVRAALDELIPAAKISLPKQVESLRESLQAGRLTAAVADPYKLLMDEGLAALQAARWDTTAGIVWIRLHWGQPPLAVAAAAVDSTAAIHNDWLSAARTIDEANHRRLLAGLGGYVKAEGAFPAGASGGALMPPETRLSWIAAMLPYYGHVDWHRRLDFGYSWNSPQNQPVTRLALAEVVNPALGPGDREAAFPTTHYVGVGGVGPDGPRLAADDPRAGVFGYGRRTRLEDITDGTSNTVAILGVTERCGPWASGGDATVRPLTKAPYVHGPDGFGSGQPDGMLAGMADGSVRFLSKDIDPRVMEQMATIHGGENVELASLDPKPAAKPQAPPEPAKPAAPPDPATPAGPQIDVRARLADPIPQIELPDMSLGQAVELLMAMSTVPISFDPDAMQELGVTLRDSVSVQLSQTTVGKALEAIVAARKLAYVIENGQVLITSPPEHRESLRSVPYTVADLTGQGAGTTAELAQAIQKLVAPDRWQPNGGRGTIEPGDGVLVVTQTGSVQYQILVFCEKLRTVRGKPTRSRFSPDLFTPDTRLDRARAMLGQHVTVNFGDPTPLLEIVSYLKKSTGAEIQIDRPALSAAGLTDGAKATLKVADQPLAGALASLLDPLGLGWRAVGPTILQVSTRKAIASRLELEFYQVGSLLAKEQPGALIQRIKSRLPGATWTEGSGLGVLYFDAPSQCLIVLQSQPVEIALEALLAEKQP